MDARLSEEQEMLRETLSQLATDLAPTSAAELPARDAGTREWAQLAGLGLLGMRLPESAGGMPCSGVEAVIAAEQLGGHLVPLPFVGSALWASSLLASAGAPEALLSSLADGSRRFAPVLDPSLGRLAARGQAGVAWESRGAEAGLVLDGATRRLVAVRLGEPPLRSVDLTRELRPVAADAEALDAGDLGGAVDDTALSRSLALALAALSGDLVGQMQASLDAAVQHVCEREQFGVPVGSFQAVQHLAAEAHVSTQAARGLAWYAGWAVDELDADEALLAARTAKSYASEQARFVVETSMQMHGGVAFTWEYLVHVHARRALVGRQTLGDEHAQFDAIAGLRAAAAG